ncbi:MAG: hypothetical protein KDC80_28485 [Saprospiraceae bacterium]|nr:hypothetical protein [Saprospiraceae bacterium]
MNTCSRFQVFIFLFCALVGFSGCEELGLDIRKVELTINGEIKQFETFDSRKIDYAVLWNRSDILSFFDISDGAEIENFWIKNLEIYYQSCAVNEAEKLDLKMFVSEPVGAITLAAFVAGKNLKDLRKTVDPSKPANLDVSKVTGGVRLLNGLLGGMVQDEDKYLNIIVEGTHYPADALVCGAILIEVDAYIVYKECRPVPFGSDAGEPCL